MRRVVLVGLALQTLFGVLPAAGQSARRDTTTAGTARACGLPVRAFVMLFRLPEGGVLQRPAILRSRRAKEGGVPGVAEVRSLVARSCGIGAQDPQLVWGAYTVRSDTAWGCVRLADRDLFRLSLLPDGSRPVIRVAGALPADTTRFTDHRLDGSELSLSAVPMGAANLVVAVFAPKVFPRASDYLERQRRFLKDVWAERDSVNWLQLALN